MGQRTKAFIAVMTRMIPTKEAHDSAFRRPRNPPEYNREDISFVMETALRTARGKGSAANAQTLVMEVPGKTPASSDRARPLRFCPRVSGPLPQ